MYIHLLICFVHLKNWYVDIKQDDSLHFAVHPVYLSSGYVQITRHEVVLYTCQVVM
jgi:hypothetical protein